MQFRIAAIAILLASPALAQSFALDRSRTVRGLCQPDGCQDVEILSAERIAAGPDGELLRTKLRTIRSSASGHHPIGVEDGYVHCSSTRPAIIAEKAGQVRAYLLAPLAAGRSQQSIRAEASQHAVYFGACHGIAAGNRAAKDPAGVAGELGYRTTLAAPREVEMARVDEILAPGRPAAEAQPLGPPRAAERRPGGFDERLDRFLTQDRVEGEPWPSRREARRGRMPEALDERYDGPYVDDAWLPRSR
jgi:hypothetical protein